MIYKRLLIAAVLVVLAVPNYLRAKSMKDITTLTVAVEVKSPNEKIGNELLKYVKKELRSIKDIKVVDKDPMYKISIISSYVKGTDTIAITIADLDYISSKLLFETLTDAVEPKNLREVLKIFSKKYPSSPYFSGHALYLVPQSDLKEFSKVMVEAFNDRILESIRKGIFVRKELEKGLK